MESEHRAIVRPFSRVAAFGQCCRQNNRRKIDFSIGPDATYASVLCPEAVRLAQDAD